MGGGELTQSFSQSDSLEFALAHYWYKTEQACGVLLTVGFFPSLRMVFLRRTPCTVTAPGYKCTASSSDSAELR